MVERRSLTEPPGSCHSAIIKPSAVDPIVFPCSGGAMVGVLIPNLLRQQYCMALQHRFEDSNDEEHSADGRQTNLGGMQFKVGKLYRSQGYQVEKKA
jgi:hypothetical protein